MTVSTQEFVVDGETFAVRLREDGGFECDWLTGPKAGYGFAAGAPVGYTTKSDGDPHQPAVQTAHGRASDERVTESIRDFLAMINLETGFIGD